MYMYNDLQIQSQILVQKIKENGHAVRSTKIDPGLQSDLLLLEDISSSQKSH